MSNAILMRPLTPQSYSAHGTAAGYSPDNVGRENMGVVWQGSSASTNWLMLDMGADVSADWIAMMNVSGVTGGNVEIRAATAAQGSAMSGGVGAGANQYQSALVPTNAGTSGLANGRRAAIWLADAGTFTGQYRYWRVSVAAGGGFQWQIGRLCIGRRIQLERNFSFGGAFGVRDFSSVDFSSRGVFLRRSAAKLRTIGIRFPHVRRDEIEAKIQPLIELAGNDQCLTLLTDPDPHAQIEKRLHHGPLVGDLGAIWRNAKAWEWGCDMVSLY